MLMPWPSLLEAARFQMETVVDEVRQRMALRAAAACLEGVEMIG